MALPARIDLDPRGVHNFSLPVLDTYFNLGELSASGDCVLHNNRVLHLGSRTKKVFVFESHPDDAALLKELQQRAGIYSIERLELTKGSSFSEIAYDLGAVFDPAAYPNAKKRAKITYPFSWLARQRFSVEPLTQKNFGAVTKLHDSWVKHKLEHPDTFRQMFPQKRYLRCCEVALFGTSATSPSDYRSWVFWLNGYVAGVRVVGLQRSIAYDLAFFVDTWNTPSQVAEYFNVYSMKALLEDKEQPIKRLNCGASLNAKLKAFKTHFPSEAVASFAYGRIKSSPTAQRGGLFS